MVMPWIASVFCLAGFYFVSRAEHRGHYLTIGGNGLWIAYASTDREWALLFISAVYLLLSLTALYRHARRDARTHSPLAQPPVG